MSALFGLIAQGGFVDDHMGGGWGWVVIVAMAVMMGGMGWMMWSAMRGRYGTTASGDDAAGHDAVEVLRARYARGELTSEEFEERLRVLEQARRSMS